MKRTIVNLTKYIENINVPLCKNCVHYTPNTYSRHMFSPECNQFGSKNMITGKIEYKSANICRIFDDYCGRIGRKYEELPGNKI